MSAAGLAAEIGGRIDGLPHRDTPSLRRLRREYSKRIKGWEPERVLELADLLLEGADHSRRFIAYELIHKHRPALQSLAARDLEHLGKGINSWAAVDVFSVYLAGPAWREHQVSDDIILQWVKSEDRWWRRAALVSTVALNSKARGGVGDAARTFLICQRLTADRDDMVVKAMSWALRELAKRDPDAVREFLAENEGSLAPRVKREVRNKLETGLKNPKKS